MTIPDSIRPRALPPATSRGRRSAPRARRAPARAGRGAFTLIEIALVVVIVLVLSAVAMPRFAGSLARYRVENAARRLQADLILAREHSIRRGQPTAVVFSTASSSYAIAGLLDMNRPTNTDYRVGLAEEPYLSIISTVAANAGDRVTFDGFGVPDSGATITLRSGRVSGTVTLDADTGEVRTNTP